MMILNLAWRNIWRHRTRSAVVITAIALGIVAALVLDAFYLGMIKTFIADSITKTTAHIQIHQRDFVEEEYVADILPESDRILSELETTQWVVGATSRTIINAMLSTSRFTRNVRIKAIDPETEVNVTDLRPYMKEGPFLTSDSRNKILMSTLMAEDISVKIGSKVVLTFQDMTGDITSGLFRVSGLFDTGSDMIDDLVIFMTKEDMIRTIGTLPGNVKHIDHEIAIVLDNINYVDTVATLLQARYPDLSVRTYRQIAPELNLYESQIDTMSWIYFSIIMAALIFGIINTMLMAVLERYREFGVLMSIGMGKVRLFILIICETLALCFTAAPIGILLGLLIVKILSRTGIDLSLWSDILEQYGMASMIYPEVNPSSFAKLVVAIGLTSILAAIYPAWKAIQLRPLEAIRKI